MTHRAMEAVFIAAGNGLVNLGRDDAAQRVLQHLNELPDNAVSVGQHWLTSLSGKIDKSALCNINKSIGNAETRLVKATNGRNGQISRCLNDCYPKRFEDVVIFKSSEKPC